MIKRRMFDEAFREMARVGVPVGLSYAKASIQGKLANGDSGTKKPIKF